MSDLHFETPENVSVNFSPAGLGTRYVAWFVDQIFVWMLTIGLLFALICAGASLQGVSDLVAGLDDGNSESVMIF
ncbi:MAG: hypothetical protein GY826_41880, partial [Fuerstiella sp.]|nr:hypothetical protein [Fuerstiella sp.]